MPTIFAPATVPGRSAITVVRMSGAGTREVLISLAGTCPAPRQASVRRLRGSDGDVLDVGVVVWMPGPRSYTGEDSAELHLHGGLAVHAAVMEALVQAGARPAEPGEFTRRAFLNGRMSLLEAEGVADLVAAETDAQRKLALRQMRGAQAETVRDWTGRLTRLSAWQEALIDFPDEDLPPYVETRLKQELAELSEEFGVAERNSRSAAKVRDGVVIAIVGAVNVGKSSLLNALTGRDAAIVSAIPGTTRDAVSLVAEFAGMKVTFVDTAGLRATEDAVEQEGIRRAQRLAEEADIVVRVVTADAGWDGLSGASAAGEIVVCNKIDLAGLPDVDIGVSAVTGEGLSNLAARLGNRLRLLAAGASDGAFNQARHEAALRDAREALNGALAAELPELRGEDMRLALRSLGRLTGAVDIESLLDVVFGSFCIGK
jgi:tRNA modification GTPase